MSAAEGLDEAAKDAADIAAFFKSGECGSEGRVWMWIGASVAACAAAAAAACVDLVPHC